ncbi:MAG: alpha/beta hydrolase [Bacilli bacterium]|nr:alpha/beta hydrolase [Bacilli bacterium]
MAEIFEITLHDGKILKGRHWPAKAAKANLVFITGMDEHSARYEGFAAFLNENGVNVWVIDHFGQGLNAPQVEDLQKWPKDAFALTLEGIEKAREAAAANGLPTIVGGHSMGSFTIQAYLETYPRADQKAIIMGSNGGQKGLMSIAYALSGMLVHKSNWDTPNPTMQNLGLGGYAKAIKDRKSDLGWLSYNEENVKVYAADPYCGAVNTGGFWHEFLRGMKEIWKGKNLKKIHTTAHILIVSGEDDPVGQMGKGVRWLEKTYRVKLGISDTKLILYPHMRHEILNEKEGRKVMEDILAFIQK